MDNIYKLLDIVVLIDEEGFFIEDIERKNLKPDSRYVETRCPNSLYRPKWTGTEWIETMTEEEYIATLPEQPERELSEIDKLRLEQAQSNAEMIDLMLMMIGGM